MLSKEKDDRTPPPYSEAQASRGQVILEQLTFIRARQIQSVIDAHILPLIEQQASYGIAQTTIAMLPSDIPLVAVQEKSEFSFESTSETKRVEVIGFSSGEEPKVILLEGQVNRTEFWRPQAIIIELERVLRESLNASSHLRGPTSPTRVGRHDSDRVWERDRHIVSRRFLSRILPSLGPEQPSPGGNPEVGAKQIDSTDLVLVKARLEEISLRTTNEFGLYDTMSKQCIIIRVDATC
ncbi:hypothetical protein ACN47E_010336 [Coniothyrium glycines]